jgi:large subunit ribosomal protein L30e
MVVKKNKKNSDSISNKLRLVIKSGKVSIGYNTTNKTIKEGKCKLIVIANNCPSTRRLELEYLAMLNKCPIHHFYGNNNELGIACGKFFSCSSVGIIDSGDSDIMNFLKK